MATIVEALGLITAALIDLFFAFVNVKAPILATNGPTPAKTVRTERGTCVGFLVEPSSMGTNALKIMHLRATLFLITYFEVRL